MNNKIIYNRGTTYYFTYQYTAPLNLGVTCIFTAKTVPNDTDITDLTNAVLTPKVTAMSGSTFPQTVTFTINPADVSVDLLPGNYYWSIKVIDSTGAEFVTNSGPFVLTAVPTNEITS